jgi:nitroreductase
MTDTADDLRPRLAPWLERHSQGIRHLVEPGPDDATLALLAEAALRAPDHAGLVPWRLAVVRGEAREALGELFAQVARERGKDEASVAVEAERGRRAPVTVAVLARIDLHHPQVPAHEQWIAIGGALANFLHAAHALGFSGKLLSGAKARAPALVQAFCRPGETLVGWFALGTAARRPGSRADRKAGVTEVLTPWTPPTA